MQALKHGRCCTCGGCLAVQGRLGFKAVSFVTVFPCSACSMSVDSSPVTCLFAALQAQPVVYVYGMNCIGTQCTLDPTGTALYSTMLPVTCLSLSYHHLPCPWQGLMLCYQSQHTLRCATNASFGGANEGRKAWCMHKGNNCAKAVIAAVWYIVDCIISSLVVCATRHASYNKVHARRGPD